MQSFSGRFERCCSPLQVCSACSAPSAGTRSIPLASCLLRMLVNMSQAGYCFVSLNLHLRLKPLLYATIWAPSFAHLLHGWATLNPSATPKWFSRVFGVSQIHSPTKKPFQRENVGGKHLSFAAVLKCVYFSVMSDWWHFFFKTWLFWEYEILLWSFLSLIFLSSWFYSHMKAIGSDS